MKNLNNPSKVFMKSENSYDMMINKYNISAILFTIITIIINVLIGNKELSLSLIKTLIISITLTSIISYIINIIKKEYNFLKLYKSDSILSIAIILAFFGVNTNTYVLILAILLTLIIKNTVKNINISSSLYGVLLITLYKYFNNESSLIIKSLTENMNYHEIIRLGGGIWNYLFSISYINPILSIISFIYLFHYKSIKYNIVLSYSITFLISISLYGIFNGLNIWYGIIEILTSGILFLTTYTISDYRMTPTISEGQVVYGIILGIISVILTVVIPELSIIITLIIGPLLLTNITDKLSPQLKYNNKLYIGVILSLIGLIVLTVFGLVVIF